MFTGLLRAPPAPDTGPAPSVGAAGGKGELARREQPLDLAVLVHDLRASGVVLNAVRIAEAAHRAGLRTELWVHDAGGAMARRLPPFVQVRQVGWRMPHLPRAIGSLLAAPVLVAALRRHRPAVVLSAGNHVHAFSAIAHRFAHRGSTALIGRVSNALAATVEPKQPGWRGRIGRALAIGLERLQYRAMDGLVAVSQELADDLARHAGVSRPVAVIPNGIDLPAIAAKSREPLDHPWFARGKSSVIVPPVDAAVPVPVIAAVGRLCRQKNFAQLLRAFALLRKERPARLAIIGNGPAAHKRDLMRLSEELGVADDVWFAGYQENPYGILSRSAVFVSTSRWEGASNVILEALACGLPVVATECPAGVHEVLANRPVARLVAMDDDAATARAIAALLDREHRPEDSCAVAAGYQLRESLARYVELLRAAVGAGAREHGRLALSR